VIILHKIKIQLFRYSYLFTFTLLLTSISTKAQFYNLPNEYFVGLLTQAQLSKIDSTPNHPTIQPYIPFFNSKYTFVTDTSRVFKFIKDDPILDKIFYDHLIHIKSKKNNKYRFTLNPLVNFENGRAYYDTSITQKISTNTRGYIANGYIGKDLYFETMFAENQSFFPHYMNKFASQTKVIPGQGRFKVFKTTGYDFAFSSGFVSYQAFKNLNIQLGHGKQKIGSGYRSLLLSDNAFNYPYLRFTSQWLKGKLQYTNLYASLMNLTTGGAKTPPFTEPLFQKKAFAFHYLSYQPFKRINIGLYQAIIWRAADSLNRQHIDWQFINPIVFSNLGFYGLNNRNNILIGLDALYKITNSVNIYGQLMIDDLSNQKKTGDGIGYQIGIRYFDALKIKNLSIQAEFNSVAESAYSNPNGIISNQSYYHYNQNLAYTLQNGQEIVALLDYRMKRVFLNAKLNYILKTLNEYNYYQNTIAGFKLGYTINSAYNFNVSLGYQYRNQDFYGFNASNNKTSLYTIAIRTNLYNSYYDF
jgi:hypothetical protein